MSLRDKPYKVSKVHFCLLPHYDLFHKFYTCNFKAEISLLHRRPGFKSQVQHTGSLDSSLTWRSTPAVIVKRDCSKCLNINKQQQMCYRKITELQEGSWLCNKRFIVGYNISLLLLCFALHDS